MRSPDESYWAEYSNLQRVKHDLIRRYLGGWFPKLATWAGRVLYVDTHAGRGRHVSGSFGSPLVALKTLLDHNYLGKLLPKCEFHFHFIERNAGNFEELRDEVRALGPLHHNIHVEPHCGDAFDRLGELLRELRATGKQIAPAFIFVDPYGFKVPGRILRELMQAGRVELFVNVMWRELGMALMHDEISPGWQRTFSEIFDGEEWRTELTHGEFDARADRAVDLLARTVGAKWRTSIRMLGDNGATKYLLVHFTNHAGGRDLMKDAIWRECPDGGFYARKGDDPSQQFLITPEPDLRPLRESILHDLRASPRRWRDLHEIARSTLWLDKHVNEVVRALRKQGEVEASSYSGRFGAASNPLLALRKGSES